MIPWSTDARESIDDLDLIDANTVEETTEIKRFLGRSDRYKVVVATKGLGKSLVLLAKRKKVQELRYTVVPQNRLLDAPAFDITALPKATHGIIRRKDSLTWLWMISLLSVAVKNMLTPGTISGYETSPLLKDLLDKKSGLTVSVVLANLLHELTWDEFTAIREEYARVLVPLAQTIDKPIAIFIDNVDECFNGTGDLWYDAQSSLVEAVYSVIRINPKIKPYVSTRKEALAKFLPTTDMSLQYEGISLILSYSKAELKDIFIRNIMAEDSGALINPILRSSNPIEAFLGTSKISHSYVVEDEESFDYIYRHTLGRPRDVMEVGAAIARTSVEERKPSDEDGIRRLKTAINEAATRIYDSYIQEVLPHLDVTVSDLEAVYARLRGNVLTKGDVKDICSALNKGKVDCGQTDCIQCRAGKHVFCSLYKVGLLGIVDLHPATGLRVQQFCSVGDKLFDGSPCLPESDYYLVHSVLNERVGETNPGYRSGIDTTNIIGNGRLWRVLREPPESSTSRPTVFASSTMDLKPCREKIEEVVSKLNFAIKRSEYENAPGALATSCNFARECHFFVALLGATYGEEVAGKSVCEHEFDAAWLDNPDKIIVYVHAGDMDKWEAKQRAFCERVQSLHGLSYARGERVSVTTIQGRFRKDLTERIARLSRAATP